MTLGEMALSNLAVALALAVVALLVGLCCRRPALTHLLWVLVLVKMVTPPLVRVSVPWPSAAVESPQAPPAPVADDPGEEDVPVEFVVGDGVPAELPPAPAEEAPKEEARPFAWGFWLWAAWVAGMIGWYALAWRRAAEFSRLLALARPADEALVKRVARLAALLGVRAPRVVMVPGRLPPLVWGAYDPVLVLPEGIEASVPEAGLDTLLMHELAHIRRGDPWVRWLEAAALGPWWWCPLAWLASRELRDAEERCCDAWVVRVLPEAKKAYAAALIDVLDFLAGAPSPPLMASGLGPVADLKRRLTMILRGATPAVMGRPMSLAVLALAALVLPLVPALAEAQAPPPPVSRAADVDKDVLIFKADDREPVRFIARLDGADDLKKLEAELARKAEELAELKRRLDAARSRPAVARLPEAKGGVTITIHIDGGKPEEIAALLKRIREAAGDKRVFFDAKLPGGRPAEGKVIILLDRDGQLRYGVPGVAAPPPPPRVPAPPPAVRVPVTAPPIAVPTPRKNAEERIDALMRELEALRRELKAAPGTRAPGLAPSR